MSENVNPNPLCKLRQVTISASIEFLSAIFTALWQLLRRSRSPVRRIKITLLTSSETFQDTTGDDTGWRRQCGAVFRSE